MSFHQLPRDSSVQPALGGAWNAELSNTVVPHWTSTHISTTIATAVTIIKIIPQSPYICSSFQAQALLSSILVSLAARISPRDDKLTTSTWLLPSNTHLPESYISCNMNRGIELSRKGFLKNYVLLTFALAKANDVWFRHKGKHLVTKRHHTWNMQTFPSRDLWKARGVLHAQRGLSLGFGSQTLATLNFVLTLNPSVHLQLQ